MIKKPARNLLNIISYITLGIAYIFVVIILFWFLYPYRVLEIKGSAFKVLNKDKTVKQGEILLFESDNCKYMNITASVSRSFVDTIAFYIPIITTNIRKGCGKVTISVPVSNLLPPGKYYIHNIFQYRVNPIRIITIEHDTEFFNIIEGGLLEQDRLLDNTLVN